MSSTRRDALLLRVLHRVGSVRWRVTLPMTVVFFVAIFLATSVALARVDLTLLQAQREANQSAAAVVSGRISSGSLPAGFRPPPQDRDTVLRLLDNGAALLLDGAPMGLRNTTIVVSGPGVAEHVRRAPVAADAREAGKVRIIVNAPEVGRPDLPAVLIVLDDAVVPNRGWEWEAIPEIGTPPVRSWVGSSTENISRSFSVVRDTMTTLIIVLVVGVFSLGWAIVGAALRPVRAITKKAREITASTVDARLPVPRGHDEITDLAVTMNEMLARLGQAADAQRRFVADASHELRSPIASLRVMLEVSALRPEDVNVEELLPTLGNEIHRLESIVDDLLTLARSGDVRRDLEMHEVDLDDVVMSEATRPRQIMPDCSRVCAGRVRGDERELTRVLRHLLDNAARHASSRVELRLSESNGAVVLCVDDDGNGVAPEDRERIFERFTRLGEARARDDGGTGLGLAVVADLVRIHGGTVTVGTSPLGGASFEVKLPCAVNDD